MDGKSHLAAGFIFAGVGLMFMQTPIQQATIPLVIGGLSGIAPDLDHHNSILMKRVTMITYWVISLFILLSAMYFSYKLHLFEISNDTTFYLLVGATLLTLIVIFFMSRLKTKKILFISGIIVIVVGNVFSSIALILIGVYFVCASQLKHRGLTHSLYFLIFWSLICYYIEKETNQPMIWLSGTLGYFSHLITDHWFTKTKIKWIKSNEIMRFINKCKT